MPMRGNQHDVRVWRSRWMQGEHVPHVGIVSGEVSSTPLHVLSHGELLGNTKF